jgi:hypothetical protein
MNKSTMCSHRSIGKVYGVLDYVVALCVTLGCTTFLLTGVCNAVCIAEQCTVNRASVSVGECG